MKNTFLRSLGIYFLGTFLLRGISVFTTPIFTRVLTLEGFGIFSIYQTWVSIFAVFIGLQMSGSIGTARVHLGEQNLLSYLRSILALSFISFFIFTILFVFLEHHILHLLQLELRHLPYLVIQSFGTACSTFYLIYTIQTKQPNKHLRFSVLNVTVTIALSLLFVFMFEQDKYMGRIIGGASIGLAIIIYVYKELYFKIKSKIDIEHWKFAIPLSLPLIVHLLANLIIGQSDRVIINKYLGFEQAAIYSVAYAIGSLGLMIAEATNNVWSPWYLDNTHLKNDNKVNQMSKLYILLMSIVFSVFVLFSPEILLIMAPSSYATGSKCIIIVAFGVFFLYLYRFPLAYQQYAKNLKLVALCTISSGLINIGLNFLFIPKYGIDGAAYATFISYVTLFFLHELVARKILSNYNIEFKNYITGFVIVFIFTVFTYVFIDELVFRMLFGFFFYFFIIWYLRKFRHFNYIKEQFFK
ncbi:oligosaccharide flippase family protein [Schleiferiaceae bacterium]|nr:oligosaccharide flippase family protein [Schleiferiaceae bacterium]